MFTWTNERVIAALAAGVPEVTTYYNARYAEATRLYSPQGGMAHARALEATRIWLVTRENALFERNVETMLATLGISAERAEAEANGESFRSAAEYTAARLARQSDANPFDVYPDF